MTRKPLLLCLALAGCTPATPPPDPATLRTLVPAAELRQILPGNFIDERPYACDSGPLALQRDGSFMWFSGWGSDWGTYAIGDGMVTLDYRSDSTKPKLHIRFRKDGNGTVYFERAQEVERELRLAPVDERTRDISCGYDEPASPENALTPPKP